MKLSNFLKPLSIKHILPLLMQHVSEMRCFVYERLKISVWVNLGRWVEI